MTVSIDYIAGIIDGEGSIITHKNKIRITIANSNKEMLDEIYKSLGFGHVSDYGKRKEEWMKECKYTTRNNNETKNLLLMIQDRLIIKHDKCKEALEHLDIISKKNENIIIAKLKAKELLKTKSIRQVAKILNVSHSTILRWKHSKKGKHHRQCWGNRTECRSRETLGCEGCTKYF